MKDIMGHRVLYLTISIVFIAFGIIFGLVRGYKFDIDFMGGTRIQVDLGENYNEEDVKDIVSSITGEKPLVQTLSSSSNMVSITTNVISEEMSTEIITKLNERYINMGDSTVRNVQASYGKELIQTTIVASLVAVILLFIYIVIRFKVLGVSAAISAVIALIHDILVMIAIYGILNLPINTTFIAVVLTILGYSINDTIVIFDKVRENKKKEMNITSFSDTIALSIKQSKRRTLYTSITTFLAVFILFVFAKIYNQQVLQEFSLPLMIGVVSGTYSSICIATSLLYYFDKIERKMKLKKK